MESLIFVSIASYRDAQLVPTIADCIAKANDPEGLRFGICWQHDADDPPFPYLDDPRFRVLDVDWRESRGACWARAQIMKLWDGEDWFLQVDSHCRFAQGWDEMALRAVIATGSAKPILSTYAPGFTPGDDEVLTPAPMQIALQAFTSDGIPQLKPAPFRTATRAAAPVRARFLAAGFLFTVGDFVEDVPYDPDLYFMGEEPSLAVRAFTHGYDLYHPHRSMVWHDYVRADAKRHWGDHTDSNALSRMVPRTWNDLDTPSRRKVARLLRGEPVESYGLGTERTLADYEAYAGISFRRRRAQHSTIRAEEPPNMAMPADWVDSIYPWIAKIRFPRERLPANSLKDPHLWIVTVHDAEDTEIYGRSFTPEELEALRGSEPEILIVVEFTSAAVPVRWVLSPMSKSAGWLGIVAGHFKESDFALLEEGDQGAEQPSSETA